jgi:DNA-binding transcriptional LysR family regulator
VAGLRADAKARSFSNSSTLRVSIQPYVATEILPRVLTDMEEDAMAKGRLEFRERTPARLVESVSSGGSDLGVLDTSSVPTGELCMEEFARVPYALFCHKDHPLTQRSRIKLAHLPAHPVILFDYCPSLRQRLGSLAAERGLELRIPFSTELAVTAFEMLAEGIGISVLPLSFQARASRRQLVTRAIEDYEEVAKVGAVWRDGCELSPQAHSFIERFRLKLRSRKD